MAGYQWWHLLGTLVFFAAFLQSFLEKNSNKATTKKMHWVDLKNREDLLDRIKKDFKQGLSEDQIVISDLEFEYLEDIVNSLKHHFKEKLNNQVLDVYEYNKRKKRDEDIKVIQEKTEQKRVSEAKAFTLERKEQEILQQRRKRNREKLNDQKKKEESKHRKKKRKNKKNLESIKESEQELDSNSDYENGIVSKGSGSGFIINNGVMFVQMLML